MSAPMIRPLLALTSSAASGFRFCGMIEEPVVKRSERRMKPNPADDQMTISSAKRERCTAQRLAAASVSMTKSRSETASSELDVARSKPSAFAVIARSIGNEVPASAAEPSGDSFEPLPRIGKPAAVARNHLDIGHEVMAEGHRLRRLEMGEAGHHGPGVLQRLFGERLLEVTKPGVDLVDGVADEEAEVGGDLVVPRPRRVEPPGLRPDQLREPGLDMGVDVFEFGREGELARFDFSQDRV